MAYYNGKSKPLFKKNSSKASKYKHVLAINTDNVLTYQIRLKNAAKKTYLTEREAALAVDMYLISKNKKPVNILKKL